MTKEQIDALLKLLDKPDVGINDGYTDHNPQSARSNVLLVSVIPVLLYSTPIEFSPAPWNKSKTSSEMCPIASRMRVTWKGMTPMFCLKSWMRFEPL